MKKIMLIISIFVLSAAVGYGETTDPIGKTQKPGVLVDLLITSPANLFEVKDGLYEYFAGTEETSTGVKGIFGFIVEGQNDKLKKKLSNNNMNWTDSAIHISAAPMDNWDYKSLKKLYGESYMTDRRNEKYAISWHWDVVPKNTVYTNDDLAGHEKEFFFVDAIVGTLTNNNIQINQLWDGVFKTQLPITEDGKQTNKFYSGLLFGQDAKMFTAWTKKPNAVRADYIAVPISNAVIESFPKTILSDNEKVHPYTEMTDMKTDGHYYRVVGWDTTARPLELDKGNSSSGSSTSSAEQLEFQLWKEQQKASHYNQDSVLSGTDSSTADDPDHAGTGGNATTTDKKKKPSTQSSSKKDTSTGSKPPVKREVHGAPK